MHHGTALSNRLLLLYGGPLTALSALLFFIQFYFLKFATDVLLLPPALVGILFAVAKGWDAVSNPLVGSWSDRSSSRWGRRRPFLFASLPVVVLGFAMLWMAPHGWSQWATVGWLAAGFFTFYTAFALYTIPHAALGAELTLDMHQRTRLFGARQVGMTLGMLLAFGGIQVAMNADDQRAFAAGIALPASIVAALILAITPVALRDPEGRAAGGGDGLRAGLRDVARNRPARILLIVWLIESTGVGAVGTLAPYVAEYLFGRPDLVGLLPASYVVAGVISIPIWVQVARRVGAHTTWLGSMLLAAGSFGGMGLVPHDGFVMLIVLLAAAGAAMGCGSVLSGALMGEIIDLDAERTGERKEGIYAASMMFVLKLGTSLATAGSGLVLGAVGFEPNVAQSDASLMGIRFLFAGLPFLGFLIGAFVFRNFPLGQRHPETVAA